jgi:hypothetical protein
MLSVALPPAVLNYILCEQYQCQPDKVASIVLGGNALGGGDPAGGLVGAASGELTLLCLPLQGRPMASFLLLSCMSDVVLLIEYSRACSRI